MKTFLEFKSITKSFGKMTVLSRVEFAVEQGQIVALLGPNGAGKSTLFGCLLGLLRPSAGEIRVKGNPVAPPDRLKFGYLPERVALYPQRSVWDNGIFFARLKNCRSEELERQLKRVGLYAVAERPVRQLSKGMLQRLGLAIALCGQPELLVLDEPFNGLDPALLGGLQKILTEENERGVTLLISTHTMSAIEPLATHAAILLQGELAASGTLDELRAAHEENSLEAVYHRIARQTRQVVREEVWS
jgi:ABC-type multidrug transport system ATPase subunit